MCLDHSIYCVRTMQTSLVYVCMRDQLCTLTLLICICVYVCSCKRCTGDGFQFSDGFRFSSTVHPPWQYTVHLRLFFFFFFFPDFYPWKQDGSHTLTQYINVYIYKVVQVICQHAFHARLPCRTLNPPLILYCCTSALFRGFVLFIVLPKLSDIIFTSRLNIYILLYII